MLTVFGPLLWLVAVAVTITGPATMCIRIGMPWDNECICMYIHYLIPFVLFP